MPKDCYLAQSKTGMAFWYKIMKIIGGKHMQTAIDSLLTIMARKHTKKELREAMYEVAAETRRMQRKNEELIDAYAKAEEEITERMRDIDAAGVRAMAAINLV